MLVRTERLPKVSLNAVLPLQRSQVIHIISINLYSAYLNRSVGYQKNGDAAVMSFYHHKVYDSSHHCTRQGKSNSERSVSGSFSVPTRAKGRGARSHLRCFASLFRLLPLFDPRFNPPGILRLLLPDPAPGDDID